MTSTENLAEENEKYVILNRDRDLDKSLSNTIPAKELNKNEHKHEIFGYVIGDCFSEYTCVNAIHNGTLYTGSKAICFFSNKVFGFERRIIIPLETITDLVRVEKTAICVKTSTGTDHTFKDFLNRDTVLSALFELAKSVPGGYATAQRNLDLIVSMAEVVTDYHVAQKNSQCDQYLKKDQNEHESFDLDCTDKTNSKQIWKDIKRSKFDSLKEYAIQNIKLSCSIDKYFSMFMDDNAENSIGKFQAEEIGDFDIKTTNWKTPPDVTRTNGSSSCCKTRIISYKHPMNIPMAPPSARATKEQILYNLSPHGICVETCTTSYDAPTTDCFTVQDAIIAEPCEDGGTMVHIKFEVRFVKNTMFKAFVELTTRKEFKKWFRGFINMLVDGINRDQIESSLSCEIDSLPSEKAENTLSETRFKEISKSKKSITPSFSNFTFLFIMLLIIMMQAGLLYHVLAIKSRVFNDLFQMTDFIRHLKDEVAELTDIINRLENRIEYHSETFRDSCNELGIKTLDSTTS